jgi:hypothetical protein
MCIKLGYKNHFIFKYITKNIYVFFLKPFWQILEWNVATYRFQNILTFRKSYLKLIFSMWNLKIKAH